MKNSASILFLGPCRKVDPATGKLFPAFSPVSRSGKFLRAALEAVEIPEHVTVTFDNVIPRALFNERGKERYPDRAELVAELEQHRIWKLRPIDTIVGLSAIVGEALEATHEARKAAGERLGPRIVRLPHPSFIMRRPMNERMEFVRQVQECVLSARVIRVAKGRLGGRVLGGCA